MSLDVDNLKVYYQTLHGQVKALDGATFSIADGEIMGLAGESGCGKTTLGTSLVRLARPMTYIEGKVRLDGVELPVWDDRAMRPFRYSEVSVIPQYAMSAMNPTSKIGKMTAELLKARGIRFADLEQEFKHRLDLVGLSYDVLDMYPIELSGGMKQRAVMVLSTLLNPSLLIADEITSALDVSSQRAVAEMLVEFRDRGWVKSVIFITHDVSVLAQIADTIMIMYAGKLAEKASADAVIHDPKHPYSKLLIESLPEVGVRYEERQLAGIPGKPPGLLQPPEGCRFRERCPIVYEKCIEQPPFAEVAANHLSACWRASEV
ncbi:MAG TPA: ABC transporter ATP-binding protein [Euzebyales bacterium]|nr:ABC transporter ATP-binding protein [Euzebyales bacterium]